jgi:uncharacterized damage-inducible protein DinB
MSEQQSTDIAHLAFGDLEHELASTRKVLERVPDDKLSWRPHQKSRTLGELAQHVAQLPWLFHVAATEANLDAGTRPPPLEAASTAALLAKFDETSAAARAAFGRIDANMLNQEWSLLFRGKVFFTIPRYSALRTFVLSHLVHHRGMLLVYLRLLDVPVPGLYGPSADEQ